METEAEELTKPNGKASRRSCAALERETLVREAAHEALISQLGQLQLTVRANTTAQFALLEQLRAHVDSHERTRAFFAKVVKYWIPIGFAFSQWVQTRNAEALFSTLSKIFGS